MEGQPKRMAIIASKGALDMAYPPLILASTAAALDYEVQIFFTFYGLHAAAQGPLGREDQPARESGDADARSRCRSWSPRCRAWSRWRR